MLWHPDGQKYREKTYKDGEEVETVDEADE